MDALENCTAIVVVEAKQYNKLEIEVGSSTMGYLSMVEGYHETPFILHYLNILMFS